MVPDTQPRSLKLRPCAGVFGVSVEVIFYSILDCVAKVWFSFAIVNRGDSSGGGGSDREDDYERQYV
jgi:bacteriorhodopsin